MEVFDFTEDGLKSNQRSLISKRQRERLKGLSRGIVGCSMQSSLIAMGFILFGFFLIAGLFLRNEDTRSLLFSSPLNIALLGASLLVAFAVIAGGIFLMRKQAEGLIDAALKVVEGKATVAKEHFQQGGSGYKVIVGGKNFSFLEETGKYFRDGISYRIYYCKSGSYDPILSVEVMEAVQIE